MFDASPAGERPHLVHHRGQDLLRRIGVDRRLSGPASPGFGAGCANPRKSNPSSMWQTLVFSSDRRKPIGASTAATSSRALRRRRWVPDDHDHEVVRVADEPHAGPPARRCLARVHSGPSASHFSAKCSSSTDRAILASSGERIPPWGVPVIVVPVNAVLSEDARLQERLHQAQDALVPDPMSHPAHEGRVVDLVEARLDVASNTHS